jgi:hypothetical protein
MDMRTIDGFQETHLAVWNERDRQKRDSMMTNIYAGNIKMYDKDFILTGHKEISDFIDKLQADPSFDFNATKTLEYVQNGARLFWNIKTSQGLLTGMDYFTLEGGKAIGIHAFMDSDK